MRLCTRSALCAAVATVALCAQHSFAASYASGVTESAGNVTFNLNEDAQNVIIYRDGVPTSLGAKARGTVSFARNSATSWDIQVVQTGNLGFGTALPSFAPGNTTANPLSGVYQSQADNAAARFNSPRGVDVNTSTTDLSLFGRVYVANSAAGTANIAALTPGVGTGLPARAATLGKGVYILDAKLSDANGQGDTARTAGLTFDSTNAASPYRVTVGADGAVYLADWSDNNGTVFKTDANVTAGSNILAGIGSGPNVVASPSLNHGSIAGVAVSGSTAAGNFKLFTMDEDLKESTAADHTQDNSVWRYDVNGDPLPFTGTPTRVGAASINSVSQTADVALSADGTKIYASNSRSAGTEYGVAIFDQTGAKLWDSLSASQANGSTTDFLRLVSGITVSKDNKYVAVVNNNNVVWVMPIDATTGLPDISKRLQFNGFGTTVSGRDIAFDAADNLYVVSSAYQALRVFAPGGTSVTTLSSNGNFTTQSAATPEWQATGSGSAGAGANWPLAIAPNASGAFVKFGGAITAPSTVTLDAATTYGSIIFDNANSYTLSGAALTLNAPTYQTTPTIYVTSGNHTIASATSLTRTANINVNAGSTLTLAGVLSGAGGITTSSPGTVEISAPGSIAALTVRGNGVVKYTAANASKVTAISTFTTAGTPPVNTFTGTVDLTNSKLVINYATTTTTTADTTRTQLANAYANGAWTGQGLSSSTAAADAQHVHSIGYVESSAKFGAAGGTFFGQSADNTAMLVAYTYAGDADLDLALNGNDFAIIDRGFAQYSAGTLAAGTAHWSDGDFDYNGTVDSNDYLIIDSTYGKLTGPLSADLLAQREAVFGEGYVSALTAAVPEPASLSLVALAAGALAARRRRA